MHETDMTKALIMTVREWWESQPSICVRRTNERHVFEWG